MPGSPTPCRELFWHILLQRTHIWALGNEQRHLNPSLVGLPSPCNPAHSACGRYTHPQPLSEGLLQGVAGTRTYVLPILRDPGQAHLKIPLMRLTVTGETLLSLCSVSRLSGNYSDYSPQINLPFWCLQPLQPMLRALRWIMENRVANGLMQVEKSPGPPIP